MNISEINEEILCVLKYEEKTNKIIIDSVEISKDLEPDFRSLLNMFERYNSRAKDIVQFIKYHRNLKSLFERYDYCTHLNRAYQGLYSTTDLIEEKYPSKFEHIKDPEKKKEAIDQEKERLLKECRERLHANYLSKAYKKCREYKEILAYSHRRVGWGAPKYPLNENFSIELKTNFGYGSVSYFYTKIKYKDLDIIPFADWVDYQISQIYEIVRYSSKHRLNNESWYEAMNYVAEACNVSTKDENLFIQKYIVNQCDEMVNGLRRILTNKIFRLKGYSFLNQERGYIDLELDEHNLTEFRGEKISGALGLIEPISKFAHIIEIKNYIAKIEECNLEVKPMIVDEQKNVNLKLKDLKREKRILEPIFNKLKLRNTNYQNKRVILKRKLIKKNGVHEEHELEKEFSRANPKYQEFKKEFGETSKEYHELIANITRYEKVLEYVWDYWEANLFKMTATKVICRKALADWIVFSKSFAILLKELVQANDRSTGHRPFCGTNPC